MQELTNLSKILEDLDRQDIDTDKVVINPKAVHVVTDRNPVEILYDDDDDE